MISSCFGLISVVLYSSQANPSWVIAGSPLSLHPAGALKTWHRVFFNACYQLLYIKLHPVSLVTWFLWNLWLSKLLKEEYLLSFDAPPPPQWLAWDAGISKCRESQIRGVVILWVRCRLRALCPSSSLWAWLPEPRSPRGRGLCVIAECKASYWVNSFTFWYAQDYVAHNYYLFFIVSFFNIFFGGEASVWGFFFIPLSPSLLQ